MKTRVFLCLLVAGAAGAGAAIANDLEQAARDAVSAKRFRDAAALYAQLSEREPANADYLVWIGRLSSWLQDYPAALDAYGRALAREPQHVDALVGQASVLMWQQKFSDARRGLSQAEQFAPNSVDVQLAFARYYHYQHQEQLAYARVRLALALEPANSEARELRAQIMRPRPLQVSMGYGREDFSFASAGNMGYVTAAYSGARRRFALQYERWNKFGEAVDRAGLSVSGRFGNGIWLRGGAMFAPGADVLPRQDYSVGFSHTWRRGVVVGADYRHLELAGSHVRVASPGVEYYFADRPVWLQGVFFQSWTDFDAPVHRRARNASFLFRYNQQIVQPLVVHVGYARGNESFAALSIDRLGMFRANTYSGGVDVLVTPACSIALSYAHQQRSGGAYQQTFAISVSVQQ